MNGLLDPVKTEANKANMKAKAADSMNSPGTRYKRIKEAIGVLKREHRPFFRHHRFDGDNRIYSNDGKFALIWTNDGETSRGSVSLYAIGQ